MNETLLQKIKRKQSTMKNRSISPISPNQEFLKRVTLSPLPPLTDRRYNSRKSPTTSQPNPSTVQPDALDISFGVNESKSCTYIKPSFPGLHINTPNSTIPTKLKPSSTKTLGLGQTHKRQVLIRDLTPGRYVKRRQESAHFAEVKDDKNRAIEALVFKKLVRQFQPYEKSKCSKHVNRLAMHFCKHCSEFYCKYCIHLHNHHTEALQPWRPPSMTDIDPFKQIFTEASESPEESSASSSSKPLKSVHSEFSPCSACGSKPLSFKSITHKQEFQVWGLCEACQNLIFPTSSFDLSSSTILCIPGGPYSELTLDIEIPILSNGVCWYSPLHFILSDLLEDVTVVSYLQEVTTVASVKAYLRTHPVKKCEEGEIILESCVDEVCQLMMDQHPRLQKLLIETQDRVLEVDIGELENVLGIHLEKNTVGKIWMRLRDEFRCR